MHSDFVCEETQGWNDRIPDERAESPLLKTFVMAKKPITPSTPVSPRDGLDNTGTQGYDSLSDDAYTGSSEKPKENPGDDESHTGSSSEDFDDKHD